MESVARESALANNHTDHAALSYASHSRSPSDGQGANQVSPVPPAQPLPHGYNHAPPPPDDSRIHPELRSTGEAYPPVPIPNMMPAAIASHEQVSMMSGPIPTMGVPVAGMDSGDPNGDGRKNKRELSQSKRAAQNRAAQRAFRQRKEGYIKKLEQQVRDYTDMEVAFKTMQNEHYALKEYVLHLQSRLIDTLGECPPPPQGVNISLPHGNQGGPGPDSTQNAATNPLEVAAQAVAGLSRSEHLTSRDHYGVPKQYDQASRDEDERTATVLKRQLEGVDGLPTGP